MEKSHYLCEIFLSWPKVSKYGNTDMTLFMPKGIYVIEVKYSIQEQNTDVSMAKLAHSAIDQINTNGYAEKYRLDGRPITKVGIAFSSSERNIADWKSESFSVQVQAGS